jgi:hypothetical protein
MRLRAGTHGGRDAFDERQGAGPRPRGGPNTSRGAIEPPRRVRGARDRRAAGQAAGATRCTLIMVIDDVTTRLTALCFVSAESTGVYLEMPRAWVVTHLRPRALCSDRQGVFQLSAKSGDGIRTRGQAAGNRADPRADASGRRPHGTGEPDHAASARQGNAFTEHLFDQRGAGSSVRVRAALDRDVHHRAARSSERISTLSEI